MSDPTSEGKPAPNGGSPVEVPPELSGAVHITTLDKIYNWGRRSSIWPMMFGLACCAIEMICDRRQPLRFLALWHGSHAPKPSPGRPDDRIRDGHQKNDANDRPPV